MNRKLFIYIALLCALGTVFATAAERKRHASASVKPTELSVKAGESAKVKFTVTLDKHWHTFPQREQLNADGIGPNYTIFSVAPDGIVQLDGKVKDPKGKKEYDEGFEFETEIYEGSVTFDVPIKIKATAKKGSYDVKIIANMQLCDTSSCIPTDDFTAIVKVTVTEEDANAVVMPADTQSTQHAQVPPPTNTETPKAQEQTKEIQKEQLPANETQDNSWATLLLSAFGLGMLSWLMPCVYPMIPITVSFFTKRAEKEHTKPFLDSLVYSLGIMTTFVVFGVVVAIFFGASAGRDIASNPWLNLALAALFLIISFNLFGAYEIQLPSGLINSLNKKSGQKHGYGASALMGMVFSMTSFTCTVPFVNTTSMMAAGGEWFKPIVAMILYAAVFALPFFLLALVPTLLTKLPRAGGWMNNIKVVFGFVEIAFAVSYFARTDSVLGWGIISREAVLAIWAGCSILITLYVLGVFKLKLDSPLQFVGSPRASFALIFATLSFYIIGGMQGNTIGMLEPFVYVESSNLNIPATTTGTSTTTAEASGEVWLEDYNQALAEAKKTGKPLFIDFTGVSCTNCRWMEKNMFPRKEVQDEMNKMIKLRLYTDRRHVPQDKINQDMQETRYGSVELPLYVILTPSEKLIAKTPYDANQNNFISFLKKSGM